jgi:hypothetical protein
MFKYFLGALFLASCDYCSPLIGSICPTPRPTLKSDPNKYFFDIKSPGRTVIPKPVYDKKTKKLFLVLPYTALTIIPLGEVFDRELLKPKNIYFKLETTQTEFKYGIQPIDSRIDYRKNLKKESRKIFMNSFSTSGYSDPEYQKEYEQRSQALKYIESITLDVTTGLINMLLKNIEPGFYSLDTHCEVDPRVPCFDSFEI